MAQTPYIGARPRKVNSAPLAKSPITPADQAEAAFLLISPKRLPRTTGQVIHVDGGLADGFLR